MKLPLSLMYSLLAIISVCCNNKPEFFIKSETVSTANSDSLRSVVSKRFNENIDKINYFLKIRPSIKESLSDSSYWVNVDIQKIRSILKSPHFTAKEKESADSILLELDGFIVSLY